MSRGRRDIDDEGRIRCGLCGEDVYIWNFWTQPVEGEDWLHIWYNWNGVVYGRPKSYCKACNKYTAKGKDAIHARRLACESRRAKRIDNPTLAHMEAIGEDAERYPDADMIALLRAMGR